tara:strand:- start:1728 stop:2168 length:441 start_codon:yes stop_codon:yes gene_type:complete
MFKIAHRGNTNGPNEKYENSPMYIASALDRGYDVEVDVWFVNNKIFLGHDSPLHLVELGFIKKDKFWCHCKNIDALEVLLDNGIRCFYHDSDDATLTSDGYIWTYPGEKLTSKSICVMPEKTEWAIPSNIAGVCSDYVSTIEEYIK